MKLTLSSSYSLLLGIIVLIFFLVANLAILGAGVISFNSGASGRPIGFSQEQFRQETPSGSGIIVHPTITRTPFQPLPPTPTPTITPSPSPTSTITPSPSSTQTLTSSPVPSQTFTSSPSPTPTSTFTAPATKNFVPTRTATHNTTPTHKPSTRIPVITLDTSETPYIEPTLPDPTQVPSQPDKAQINNITGHPMWFALDCEAAAAVGLAEFFGVSIDHMDFLVKLPYTDDPETGFVGSYNDLAGNIPPYSYGVHAAPVAKLLRAFGLDGAVAKKNLSFERIKKEIAGGRPVMVWVIGSVQYGTPVEYTAKSTGNTTTVAAFEHTVLVVGYDENYVTILDGVTRYPVLTKQFLKSWGVLGNMAVVVNN